MSSNTNIGNTPVNQGYVQLVHMGETGGIDGTLRTLYDGDGTASDLQIASNKVKISTELYIGSKTATEFIQDIVGSMFTTGSYTNITTTYDDTNGNIDLNASGDVTLSNTVTLSNKTLAAPILTGTTQGASITLSGDLTVNGTTTTVNQTNLDVSDNIIGLNRGAGSNANDSGIIIERGSTGDNAAIIWDESADKFTLGTTTSTPSATGDLTISTGTLVAALEGNATTATGLATGRTISLTGDVTGTSGSFNGTGDVSISATIAANSVALSTDTTGNYVGTITASSGLSSTGATSGEGIAHSISVNAGQVGITSIYNSSLKIGTASDGQIIDFNTSDEIRLGSSTQATVKIKTDPLGSAQDEVIIGDGSYDVDFVVDGSGGSTIFKVDAGTGNTAVTGDLSVSGSFSPATVTASTSVRTPLIEFTDGDDAITIADGGAMTFAKGFAVTSGASSFGANVAIKNTGGTTLQLNTSSTDVDSAGVLGRINFSAPDESAGSDSNLLAASIVAQATADFTASSNKTDMIFQLGVSETASEKFRIVSDGKIKIGGSYTLPSSDGSANQVLKTNGSGTVSFADESAGAVSAVANGSNNRIATFSSSDALNGEANLTFDGTSLQLSDGKILSLGDSDDIKMYHSSSSGNANIENYTNSLFVTNYTNDADIIFRTDDGSGDVTAYLTLDGSTGHLVLSPPNNVGIGESSPSFGLQIDGANFGGDSLKITRGTSAFTIIQANNSYGVLGMESNHDLQIRTNGSTRMTIDNSGDVKIEESLGIGVAASSTTGRLDCSNDVVAYASSDERLKENIKPLDNALDKVLKISGVEFDWKELTEEEKETIHGNEGHDVGVIAQEIEEVMPEVVTTRDNGYKAVKYEKLVPLLIESIKELKTEIEEFKNG